MNNLRLYISQTRFVTRLTKKYVSNQIILLSCMLLINACLPYALACAQENLFDGLLGTINSYHALHAIIPAFIQFAIVKFIYSYGLPAIIKYISISGSSKLLIILQEKVNSKIIKLPYALSIDPSVVDAKRNADETTSCAWAIWQSGLQLAFGLLSVIISLLYLLPLGLPCFFSFLLLLIPTFVFSIYSGSQYYDTWSKLASARRKVEYYFDVLTGRQTAHERSFFQYKPFFMKRWENDYKYVRSTSISEEFKGARLVFLSSIILCIYISSLVGYCVYLAAIGNVDISYVISLVSLFPTLLLSAVKDISTQINSFGRHMKSCSSICEIYNLPEEQYIANTPKESLAILGEFKTLEFIDVCFSYPKSDECVLEHVSFKCEAGQHYAFVGKNGAGKTTIVNLLMRLYSVQSGEIRINGTNINDLTREELNYYMCAIFQDYTKYLTTICENIGIGNIKNLEDVNLLIDSVKATRANVFIDQLPAGLETKLGKQRNAGVELSGGEWQKLAFSRLLFSDCPVKILDEPTSSMDPEAESELYRQYFNIMQGKTTIFITHRLASTVLADKIFVIDKKTIAEAGTHQELMERKGIYFDMFSKQSKLFSD